MLQGHPDSPIRDGWRSTAVRDALDLCLACKGCKHDCPASVDMATYKAEFLAHHYAHRLRPRADYATGWLPAVAAAVRRTHSAGAVNSILGVPAIARAARWVGGLEDRPIPTFAPESLQQWWAGRGPQGDGSRGSVILWPDTFTNTFAPQIGRAAVDVLEAAGWRVEIPSGSVCCGLTWISTGQLKTAKRMLRRTVSLLADHVRSGGLVVGLEPSCTAVFRSDAAELFSDDQDVHRLKANTVTFAELLMEHTPGWLPTRTPAGSTGSAGPAKAIAQVHCHQHAVMGWEADQKLLETVGVDAEALESGCCGLAGNFGFTAGHGAVSRACAEQVLLPRVRAAAQGTTVLADGFSCRTQIHDLDNGGRDAVHMAELVADRIASPAHREMSPHPGGST